MKPPINPRVEKHVTEDSLLKTAGGQNEYNKNYDKVEEIERHRISGSFTGFHNRYCFVRQRFISKTLTVSGQENFLPSGSQLC